MTPDPAVIEATVAAAGARPAAGHKHRRKLPHCANCGFAFAAEPAAADNFCPRCGQENHELNVPFKHLVLEFLEGTLHFDSKFFQSLRYLLLRPGFLTREFNAGHRAGYVPPIRLYVFTSFLFFIVLSWSIAKQQGEQVMEVKSPVAATPAVQSDTVSNATGFKVTFEQSKKPISISIDQETFREITNLKTDAQLDSFMRASGIEPTFVNKVTLKQAARLSQGGSEKFMNKAIKNTSILMFVLMPVFGLLLGLAYRRHKRHYVEFLMFSLHYHTFLFVLFGLYLLLPQSVNLVVVDALVLVLPVLYLALAMRQVYPQSWGKVALKSVLVSMAYSAVLSVFMMATLLVSFALF